MVVTVDTNSGEDTVFDGASLLLGKENVERRRLDVGDVRVEVRETCYVIERKTWSDLGASILDGRMKEQKSRMTGPEMYAYVVEGASVLSWNGQSRGMQNKCLWASIVKTSLRDSIPVFHTDGPDGTASLVSYLHGELEKGTLFSSTRPSLSGFTLKRKRDNLTDPSRLLTGMLTLIPGMSAAKASKVVEKWGTVSELCSAREEELAALECGGRKLGPKLAKAVSSVFFFIPPLNEEDHGVGEVFV